MDVSSMKLKTNFRDKNIRGSVSISPYLVACVSISSCQRNLMKTYHNEAITSGITKIASKNFLEFFEQSS